MTLGYFIADENKNLLTFSEETLNFARTDTEIVRWHRGGKAMINDIVLCIGLRDDLMKNSKKAVIYRYDNEDSIPFVKEFDGDIFEKCGIDTVYSGMNIKFDKDGEGNNIVEVKGRRVRLKSGFSAGEVALILADEAGIKYCDSFEKGSEKLEAVLKGEEYGPKIYDDEPLTVEDLFGDYVAVAVARALNDGICTTPNGKITVKRLQKNFGGAGNTLFSIGDENAYLETVKDYTKIYDALYFNRNIRVNDTELHCEARLKGYDKEIDEINEKLEKVCRKNVTIVLTGESGTGKTYLAKQIHKNSRRASGPFVNVNCASISYNLIESELFGYEEGAFTGAKKGGKIGYFELAKGGTLFLDEISELPIKLQGKLLEVIQEGTFYRVGGIKKISADVRLIVATNRNLEKMVKDNKFREDLYYRINVFPIKLPPLRERLNDLYSIIDDTLPAICKRLEIEPLMVTSQAFEKMKKYSWPGNIRELENVLEKAAVMADENFIREEDIVIADKGANNYATSTLKEKMNEYEREIIFNAFEKFNGNRKQMADYLGISKTNLFEKIHKYKLYDDGESGDF